MPNISRLHNKKIKNVYMITALISAFATIIIGCVAFVGRLLGPRIHFMFGREGTPVNPGTALLFMAMGCALFVHIRSDANRHAGQLKKGLSAVVIVFSFIALFRFFSGFDLGLGQLLPRMDDILNRGAGEPLSPVDATIFLFSGLSALFLFMQPSKSLNVRYFSVGLSSLPLVMGAVALLSSWYGPPLLYGETVIPVAIPAVVGFIMLGLGLLSSSALIMLPRETQSERISDIYSIKRDIPAIITLIIGITLALVTFIFLQRMELKNIQGEFNIDTGNYSVALAKSIDGNMNALHALEGLYAASPNITRAKFHTFADSVLPHSPGIHSLRWIPRVASAERKKYEASAVKDGFAGFRFVQLNSKRQLIPAGKRDEYFPVYFTEPVSRDGAILGLDLSARPVRRASLEKARDTGAAVATSRITLLQESGRQFSFLVLQPIYRNAVPHDTVQERRKNLFGYAAGVFRMGDMVDVAIKGIKLTGIEIALFDNSAPPEKRLLYTNISQENAAGTVLNSTETLKVADRQWTVTFYATPEYLSAHKTFYSWALLAAGILATILLALYILNRERSAFEIERSKDVLSTVLDSIAATIAIIDANDMKVLACNKVLVHEAGAANDHEIIGRRCHEIMHTCAQTCSQGDKECPLALAAQTGAHAVLEHIHHDADGSERHVEVRVFPMRDDAGNVTHMVHIGQDITERKQAEKSRLQEQQVRRLSAERQVAETQLRMLQAQIEPHFLFNTLANVISLIEREPVSAKGMLQHLTNSLRLSLQRSRKEISTLAQEAEILRDYLSIFKMRLGSRLEFSIDMPEELLELPLPPMLLQPLVENAVIHGIEPKVEGGRVSVTAEKTGSHLLLTVSDTGLGVSRRMSVSGLGLDNVKARLQALYGDRARLTLTENTPRGITAMIEVPL